MDARPQCAARAMHVHLLQLLLLDALRDQARQELMVKNGASKTMDSHHLPNADGMAEAVDLLPYPYNVNGVDVWQDKQRFAVLAGLMYAAAALENVPIRWGGDWDFDGNNADSTFHDMPHFELRRPS